MLSFDKEKETPYFNAWMSGMLFLGISCAYALYVGGTAIFIWYVCFSLNTSF